MMQQPGDQQQQYGQAQQQPWMMQSQGGAPPQQGWVGSAAAAGGSEEIRSLWIGDLQQWMDESYLKNIFTVAGEAQSQPVATKVIRSKQTGLPEGYGFIEFASRAAADRALQTYNGSLMPNTDQNFRLNWATLGAGERRQDDGPEHTIFVGDLAADVTDYTLQETFRAVYQSVKGAKVVTDRTTGRSKGYGFVRFSDEGEQMRAMTEMNGHYCSTRPMRVGPAATKKPIGGGQQYPKAYGASNEGGQGESDPNNTTIFVGGLDASINDDMLRQVFGQFGELVHVKIPLGKRCGFVQYVTRAHAEQAISMLNGTQLGGQSIRLSWGRSPTNKQGGSEQSQWNGGGGGGAGGGYYGYPPQGYEAYGYGGPPAQDPSMYYGGYAGYGGYQQPGAYNQPQQPQQ